MITAYTDGNGNDYLIECEGSKIVFARRKEWKSKEDQDLANWILVK